MPQVVFFPPHVGFATKTFHAFLISPIHHTFPTYLIFLDWVTLVIFDDEYCFILCQSRYSSVFIYLFIYYVYFIYNLYCLFVN